MTENEKKQEETQTGTIILFLDPFIFDTVVRAAWLMH